MKQAILVVSFGSTHLDTLENAIAGTEAAIAAAFPEAAVFRAFTSNIIRRRLLVNQGISVDSVQEALIKIAAGGFTHVTVQPTLLIPGTEYDRIREAVRAAAGDLTVRMGAPLLVTPQDQQELLTLLPRIFPVPRDTVLLMMGHGTEHPSNRIYEELAERMQAYPGMALCTVEGTPTFRDAVSYLRALPQRKAVIAPLMLVAGDHAKNDMASREPDSLRSLLEEAGFQVSYRIQGLGQIPEIRQAFISRIQNARLLP